MAITTRLYEEVQNNSEALVLAHLGMVKRVALHLKVRLPPFMERHDWLAGSLTCLRPGQGH
jgi:RNA polymerase sigma factor for flagellar operon FliA